jgi:DNA-binding transcriptional MocR family regulator
MDEASPKAIPRAAMAADLIRQRIANRSLAAGAKLPSIRKLAAMLSFSTSTIVEAYDRLLAEGAIASRPGAGFFVARHVAPFELAAAEPRLDRAIDPFWVSRQSLESGDDEPKPGCGWLPSTWLPEEGMRKALRQASRAPAAGFMAYSSPLGLPALRTLLSRRMAEKGVEAGPDQIMLTESGIQAIDLLCRLLLSPGDTVMVDDPCYFNFQALLRAHRARIVSVPYTPHGPDLELFAKITTENRPRIYLTNSALHNPTGAVLSSVTAHRVLKQAELHDLVIIEDDIFADFEERPAPRLAAFDGLERVIQIGSFSKTLSASARCGYIAAKRDWIDALIDIKIATSFGGGRLSADLTYAVLSDGGYRKHLETLRARLSQARLSTTKSLRKLGIEPWIEPDAGMFLWCRLPDGLDAADVARAGLKHNLVLAPGNAFSHAQTATGFMRFNVAQMSDDLVFERLKQAMSQAARQGAGG